MRRISFAPTLSHHLIPARFSFSLAKNVHFNFKSTSNFFVLVRTWKRLKAHASTPTRQRHKFGEWRFCSTSYFRAPFVYCQFFWVLFFSLLFGRIAVTILARVGGRHHIIFFQHLISNFYLLRRIEFGSLLESLCIHVGHYIFSFFFCFCFFPISSFAFLCQPADVNAMADNI